MLYRYNYSKFQGMKAKQTSVSQQQKDTEAGQEEITPLVLPTSSSMKSPKSGTEKF